MKTLPITQAMHKLAKARGWIKTALELFPDMPIGRNTKIKFLGELCDIPDPRTEIWISGSIAP